MSVSRSFFRINTNTTTWLPTFVIKYMKLSTIPFDGLLTLFFSSPDKHLSVLWYNKMCDILEEGFPVLDKTYYELRIMSRTSGNIQDSVPSPMTLRSESLLIGVIRCFADSPSLLEKYVGKLLSLRIDPDGLTSDGPSWITPLVACEIYLGRGTAQKQKIRDRIQRLLILSGADVNETGWCGKNVLHYRVLTFCQNPTPDAVTDVIRWINLPCVTPDIPLFEWKPVFRSWSLMDYLDDMFFQNTRLDPEKKRIISRTMTELLYSYGYPVRSEDINTLPTIADVCRETTTSRDHSLSYVFYKERIAMYWQLSWSQLQHHDWKNILMLLQMWTNDAHDMVSRFFRDMWATIEKNRQMVLNKHFFMDSIEMNPPSRFPYSWTITLYQHERSYQVWGGYTQMIFKHPINPSTGETIPLFERERIWDYHIQNNRLLLFWKQEIVLPESLEHVVETIRTVYPRDKHNVNIFTCGIHVFLQTSSETRSQRDKTAVRCVFDRISSWIRHSHPYSNFHQMLDSSKLWNIRFWRYMFQILAYTPHSETITCVPLTDFQNWVTTHISRSSPYRLRLLITEHDDPNGSDMISSFFSLTIDELIGGFLKCVYLSVRENMNNFHYRYECEWAVIEFFFRCVSLFGRETIRDQEGEYFQEFLQFTQTHSENYPFVNMVSLHKRISALLHVFPDTSSQQQRTQRPASGLRRRRRSVSWPEPSGSPILFSSLIPLVSPFSSSSTLTSTESAVSESDHDHNTHDSSDTNDHRENDTARSAAHHGN